MLAICASLNVLDRPCMSIFDWPTTHGPSSLSVDERTSFSRPSRPPSPQLKSFFGCCSLIGRRHRQPFSRQHISSTHQKQIASIHSFGITHHSSRDRQRIPTLVHSLTSRFHQPPRTSLERSLAVATAHCVRRFRPISSTSLRIHAINYVPLRCDTPRTV